MDDPAAVRAAARTGLWALHREFTNPRRLEAAAALAKQDAERGFEAVSRYVHTHPCAWDAQILLASLALGRQSFELTIKLLADVRWLYAKDPDPHFVYGQALASKGHIDAALPALEHAARLAPHDADIARWLAFARSKLPGAAADRPARRERRPPRLAHAVAPGGLRARRPRAPRGAHPPPRPRRRLAGPGGASPRRARAPPLRRRPRPHGVPPPAARPRSRSTTRSTSAR